MTDIIFRFLCTLTSKAYLSLIAFPQEEKRDCFLGYLGSVSSLEKDSEHSIFY